jgi:hypothetical protein
MDNYWTAHIILGQFYVGGSSEVVIRTFRLSAWWWDLKRVL